MEDARRPLRDYCRLRGGHGEGRSSPDAAAASRRRDQAATRHGLSVLPDGVDGHFIKLPAALAETAVRELEARLA
jgi:hypothetical protein